MRTWGINNNRGNQMSRFNMFTTTMFVIAVAYYGQVSYAASGKGGSKVQNPSAPAASTEIRLRAKWEDPAQQNNPELQDTLPEFHADYRLKSGVPQLQVRVENIELGTVVDVFVQNLKIGSATVVQDGLGTEAALDFKKGAWPAGLPTTLTAGMVVRIFSGSTLLFEAPFQ